MSHPWMFIAQMQCYVISVILLSDFSKFSSAQFNVPKASDDLPIKPLQESPDPKYDPAPTDLSPNILKQQLGGDFVPKYMSVSRPLESIIKPNGSLDYSTYHIPQEIKQLRFAKFPGKFGGKARRSFRKKIRQFLAAYTFCPINYRWTDLGVRFFPRWIRQGVCYNEPGHSCSIPASNKCQSSKSQNLRLLRWHCRNWDRGLFCRWISIWYPIITACECKC
ncbi:noggin-like [Paramacrobiotus metropolitanus]|uniref:noggin-like n=1 Tax=Paramacrobiotus metropolitanus TaxID=2943436 RepID=UPI002445C931|nr:noggin-like [Paramacrobiotus metropolitanus]